MEENLNFSLEQEPAADFSVTAKKRVKPIVLIVGAALLCAALIVGIVLATLFAKSPFEKTMRAVFPSTELFEELVTEGGTLTLDGELADDLLGEGLQEPFCFSADYAFSLDGTLVTLTAGAKDDRVDLSLLQDEKGLQMYSDRLLGDKAYGVAFDGLMDAIDASPFAPKSGTAYALPRDVYDMIDRYAELLEDPQTYENTALVFAKATNAMLEKTETYKKKETVSLADGDTKAKVFTYIVGEDAINAFVDTLSDEWENNEAFREEIESADPEGQLTSFAKAMVEELKARDETLFEGFTVTYKYAVKGGYLVYADALLSLDDGDNDSETLLFAVRFTENPKKDPSYEIEFSSTDRGKTTTRYLITYSKSDDGKKEEWNVSDTIRSNRFAVVATYGENAAFALQAKYVIDVDVTPDYEELLTMWQLELEGTLRKTDDTFALGIDEMRYEDKDGNTLFHMSGSSFGICLESGKPSVKRRENETNLLGMSVAELDELGAKLEGELVKAIESIGDELGLGLVRDTYMPNALATVTVESHLSDYAYDRSNGHLFFAYSRGTSGEIRMYDAKTMELIDTLELDDPVLAIDADNGYLAFVYDVESQQIAYIHSSADMTYIKKFDYTDWDDYYLYMQYPGDVLVDGETLIYVSGDQFVDLYFTDIKTGKTVSNAWSFHEGKLSIDRDNHIVAALENGLSACNLLFFSTVECKLVEEADRFDMDAQYLNGAAHFDGKVFWATADEWYMSDESGGTLATALGFSTRGALAMVVYRDENLVATLEVDPNGAGHTAFYRADGTYCGSVSELYTWMQPLDDNHYLAAYQDGSKTVFAYCELIADKTIG